MFCNVAIDNGEKDVVGDDQDGNEINRYTFKSAKLGLFIIAYTNPTNNKYATLQEFDISGNDSYQCSREISEDNYVGLSLAPFSKKSMVFRTVYKSDVNIKLLEFSMKVC